MRATEEAVKASGVAYYSAYDDFLAYERRADRQPLYGMVDYHLSPAGTRLLGQSLARALETMRPWPPSEGRGRRLRLA